MMRLALPGGRLWPHSQALMARLGISEPPSSRRYVFTGGVADVEILALKIPDIAALVHHGRVDIAVASGEWLAEHDTDYVDLGALCWYHVRICLLAPTGRDIDLADGRAHSVATPYPRLARRLLPTGSIIEPVRGAVEAYPGRLTDLALDCVETGTTAAANGLVEVAELMRCDVRLVASPHIELTTPDAVALMSLLGGEVVDHCPFTTPVAARPR